MAREDSSVVDLRRIPSVRAGNASAPPRRPNTQAATFSSARPVLASRGSMALRPRWSSRFHARSRRHHRQRGRPSALDEPCRCELDLDRRFHRSGSQYEPRRRPVPQYGQPRELGVRAGRRGWSSAGPPVQRRLLSGAVDGRFCHADHASSLVAKGRAGVEYAARTSPRSSWSTTVSSSVQDAPPSPGAAPARRALSSIVLVSCA